ncbi:auxin-responsive family protein [Striga asiatica]|uniref:Auxin-responsive family protein n=1 Tax=Striga asiatica TaxID=4170 RepID=A0A5A7R5V7_STRAF|nr:auxin-responsive family protein [Striga asiatica]
MTKYVCSRDYLRILMNLLRESSKSIQIEAFRVFKLFAANQNKPPDIVWDKSEKEPTDERGGRGLPVKRDEIFEPKIPIAIAGRVQHAEAKPVGMNVHSRFEKISTYQYQKRRYQWRKEVLFTMIMQNMPPCLQIKSSWLCLNSRLCPNESAMKKYAAMKYASRSSPDMITKNFGVLSARSSILALPPHSVCVSAIAIGIFGAKISSVSQLVHILDFVPWHILNWHESDADDLGGEDKLKVVVDKESKLKLIKGGVDMSYLKAFWCSFADFSYWFIQFYKHGDKISSYRVLYFQGAKQINDLLMPILSAIPKGKDLGIAESYVVLDSDPPPNFSRKDKLLWNQSSGVQYTAHRIVGIVVFCLGTLQVTALLLRPKKEHKHRIYWNLYHHTIGYSVIILSIINIFKGLTF